MNSSQLIKKTKNKKPALAAARSGCRRRRAPHGPPWPDLEPAGRTAAAELPMACHRRYSPPTHADRVTGSAPPRNTGPDPASRRRIRSAPSGPRRLCRSGMGLYTATGSGRRRPLADLRAREVRGERGVREQSGEKGERGAGGEEERVEEWIGGKVAAGRRYLGFGQYLLRRLL